MLVQLSHLCIDLSACIFICVFSDSVVCVGGDGMFSEVMHGLIGRTQKDSGIDQNDPTAPLVPCKTRIGIIPAGKNCNKFKHYPYILIT